MNTYVDVTAMGALRFSRPGLAPDEVPARSSCALDIADAGNFLTLEEVGDAFNFTRERARQVLDTALASIARTPAGRALLEEAGP
jgi:hypothetical protein